MTFAAIRRSSVPCKLTFVKVGVAVIAFIVFQRVGYFSLVAFGTGQAGVFPRQGKSSFVVVEGTTLLKFPERNLCMALLAVLPEFVVVHIFMTAGTVAE